MSVSLKLISLNIERHKHLDLVEKFLAQRMPDVVCLQEVFEHDLERLARAFGATSTAFEPMGRLPEELPPGVMGVAILSRVPIRKMRAHYYAGIPGVLNDAIIGNKLTFQQLNKLVLTVELEKEGKPFRIATTHFTWTPDGAPDEFQRAHILKLLTVLEGLGEFVFCGDLNAPRGGEIFDMLSAKYKDNIPPHYETSLDISLHRAGKSRPHELENKMVDGLFSTPAYLASGVELVPGVSDHMAIVADITLL